MNIFRDLVEELKEENLLEETVIEPGSEEQGSPVPEPKDAAATADAADGKPDASEELPRKDLAKEVEGTAKSEPASESPGKPESEKPPQPDEKEHVDKVPQPEADPEDAGEEDPTAQQAVLPEEPASREASAESAPGSEKDAVKSESLESSPANAPESEEHLVEPAVQSIDPSDESEKLPAARTPEQQKKFFRQRAMDEVTGLQLVEHVLSGVEREQMKKAPKPFDDLAVKRALHDFLKIADDLNSPEHAKSEFQLMQETENWASALSRRDRNIAVADLRRYCETTKPALSSQAMISLARFYRNSPFSEAVRSKFDLVFTKLFSKDIGNDKRAVVFKNEELVKHIQELYADWSSIPLYSTDDDDSELLLLALKFQEFINEARDADTFDELVRKDFFKRLKVFKEDTQENFFAPILIAAAIESNVAVGNRYVELIEKERRSSGETIGDKYGITQDSSISEATSKTLELLDMLRVAKPEPEPEPAVAVEPEADAEAAETNVEAADDGPHVRFSIGGGANKWLIVVTVIVALVTGWYFMQGASPNRSAPAKANGQAKDFTIIGTPLERHVHSARISKETLFGITRESWNSLSKEEKEKFVETALSLGEGNKFSKVHLLNKEGQTVAYSSKTQLAIY